MGTEFTYSDISKMIDHSLLSPTLSADELHRGCLLAKAYDVASVCILPYALPRCVDVLQGSDVAPSSTVGFPHGGQVTSVKAAEAKQSVADGCLELDMVSNISKVLSHDWDYVRDDIKAVTEIAHAADRRVKVIFENCYLDDAEKIRLCEICSELNVDWVKTSTGYGTGGATMADLRLMRQHAADHVQVKAAGGIRDLDKLLEVRALGMTRIGASRTQSMLDDCRRRLGLEPVEFETQDETAGY